MLYQLVSIIFSCSIDPKSTADLILIGSGIELGLRCQRIVANQKQLGEGLC